MDIAHQTASPIFPFISIDWERVLPIKRDSVEPAFPKPLVGVNKTFFTREIFASRTRGCGKPTAVFHKQHTPALPAFAGKTGVSSS
jgi:hypothetical protein